MSRIFPHRLSFKWMATFIYFLLIVNSIVRFQEGIPDGSYIEQILDTDSQSRFDKCDVFKSIAIIVKV